MLKTTTTTTAFQHINHKLNESVAERKKENDVNDIVHESLFPVERS